ncbi:MAG: GatB/YqeY domain-containing protein [Candidatus Cloacimonetes bacterium]|nr:GatB/YqeY domain-containing protein [Candidatus Cloacimonadota bacterium]MCF7814019.1 GatB/YqeY domain-containing protein [Candidatus Cloacimonadota bacterium]MCF7868077.1 GatB/YqeY domain-containing protein [Candidatus Cloacimonadota bacterium]MCF7883500.1 GatB/YqeY domain-containing protein [Candidatus Cloacimonadota bacterium]
MIQDIEKAVLIALRSKDQKRLKVLRSVKAALKYAEIEKKQKLSEDDAISVLQSQIKSRKQAIELYEQGNRPELAANEQYEIEVIESFLPEPLSEEELAAAVNNLIAELEATSMKDMGKVMKALKEKLGNQADGKILSMLVRQKLQA